MMIRKLIVLALALATGPAIAAGYSADGYSNAGPRPDGQMLVTNRYTGGHTILTMEQTIPCEESAIESVGKLSNGQMWQQGAGFFRFVNCNNNAANFENSWSMHLTGAGYDYTPLVLLARNSAILCAGYTPTLPWEGAKLPPAAWVNVRCPQKVDGFQIVGPNLKYDRHFDVGMTVEGRGEFGDAKDGYIDQALQVGYSTGGQTAYLQGYANASGKFLPLVIGGSDISVGYQGQKVGFRGAAPINVPVVEGSWSDGSAQRSLARALAAQGLIVDRTTP